MGSLNSKTKKDDSEDGYSSTGSASAAEAVLDDLRLLVRGAERERGVDLLEAFEHFDRRGQVGLYPEAAHPLNKARRGSEAAKNCAGIWPSPLKQMVDEAQDANTVPVRCYPCMHGRIRRMLPIRTTTPASLRSALQQDLPGGTGRSRQMRPISRVDTNSDLPSLMEHARSSFDGQSR